MMNPAMRQTKAKRQALGILAEYFCLNTILASELLGISERAVQAHYQRLVAAQLVYAKSYEPETYEKGALPKAYGLTDSGVKQAFREGFATDSTKSFRGHALRTIEHELMISKFHLELVKLAAVNVWDLHWRQSRLDKRAVRPDALFRLNGHNFFLEIERARLGDYRDRTPRIIGKLQAYREYHASTDCENDFGFRTFRIITVMRTPRRVENLTQALTQAGQGSGFFWNASEDAFFDFTTPKPNYAPSFASLTRE
jgi:hypothetical protein